jgi:nitroreductase
MPIRSSRYPIVQDILNRWSSRALSGESITQEQLMTLFEAAHLAPSSYNNQPWRFIYAHKGTPGFERLFNLLVPFNQSWCKNAAVLVVIYAKKNFEFNGSPSVTHAFDTGAAWGQLGIQATHMGLIAHGMEGFDYVKAAHDLNISDEYTILAMCALGKQGKKTDLSHDLQVNEVVSGRKELEEFCIDAGAIVIKTLYTVF